MSIDPVLLQSRAARSTEPPEIRRVMEGEWEAALEDFQAEVSER